MNEYQAVEELLLVAWFRGGGQTIYYVQQHNTTITTKREGESPCVAVTTRDPFSPGFGVENRNAYI